ncbi:Flp pilus assembly protein CpaB [Photobacterium atrarenae]|uniref:Flp pilus assembly protein CpaB n=1 Tax=Photobacterium atrarenae TaxID=865757 RepID=A0ABY5GIG7_9GAMM|nr:Flp pilus assembly protein CpaB [Photobacterium atrarenae]UTV28601.1 Flp pilus assembly protein CpaB [Photobacterium atrarenae]
MQGRYLKIAAAVLLGLAVVIGLYGVRLSQPPAPAPTQAKAPSSVIMPHFAADLPVGTVLRAEMLQPMPVAQPLAKDIRDPSAYLGRRLIQPVVAGSRLRDTMFSRPRPLIDELNPGFRAIALQANALTVVGGHLQSGDWVDVLYLLRANKESGHHSTARRLLSRIQVLAVGQETIGQPEQPSQTGKGKGKRDSARTIVLAIPEAETPQLLLAESTGQLRLTLVSPDELPQPAASFQLAATGDSVSDMMPGIASQAPVSEAPAHAAPEPAAPAESYVVSLKTLGGYQEVDVPAVKPPPVKYRYVAPSIEVYQGESRALVQTRF